MKKQEILLENLFLERERNIIIGVETYNSTALKLLYKLGLLDCENPLTVDELKIIDKLASKVDKWDYLRKRYNEIHGGESANYSFFLILEKEGLGEWTPNGQRFMYKQNFPGLPGTSFGCENCVLSIERKVMKSVYIGAMGQREEFDNVFYVLTWSKEILEKDCTVTLSEDGTRGYNKLASLAKEINKICTGTDKIQDFLIFSPYYDKYIVDPRLSDNSVFERINKLL